MPIKHDISKSRTEYYSSGNTEDIKKQYRWWTVEDEKNIYHSVVSVCESILLSQSARRRQNFYFSCLYSGTGTAFGSSRSSNLYYNRTAADGTSFNNALTLNAVQSAIDTAASMIAKNKPKPQFLTNEADSYNTKVRGQKLTDFVAGVFDELKIYELMQRVFLDACIWGTGCLKLHALDNKLQAERIFIEEILVDDIEGMHDHPRQIHQRKYMNRDEIVALFPEYEKEIRGAPGVAGGSSMYSTADVLPVIESWHLKSGKKAKDGLHTICIENCTLRAEPYTKDHYPFVFFRWADEPLGFWGRGICHSTWKLQKELDNILQTIQAVYRRVSGPILAVESGSNIVESQLTSNKLVKIIEYTTTKPEYITPTMVQAEMYEQAQYLEQRIFTISGVNQQKAEGQKAPEVRAAVAIRETNDLAAGRFELVAQRYEQTFLSLADMIVDLSADIDNPTVMIGTKNGSGKVLSFKEAMVDRENYKLQLFPISGLPSSPAGRLDQLMDYVQMGAMSMEDMMDIVDFPDLRDRTSLDTAPMHLVQQILSNIKEDGKEGFMPPSPYMDLGLAYKLVCQEVVRSQLQNVDEAHIDLLRTWANQCQDLLTQAQATQQAAVQPVNQMPQDQMSGANVQPQPQQQPQGQ